MILAFGLIKGMMSGFVKQIASVVGVILGIAAAYLFAGTLAVKLSTVMTDTSNSLLLAFSYFLIFTAVVIVCNIIGYVMRNLLSMVCLKGVDRLAGAGAGLLKYVIILGVLINFYHSLDKDGKFLSEDTRQKAKIYYPLQQAGEKLLPYVNELQDHKIKLKQLKKKESEGNPEENPEIEI
ncbi:MAG: CvpA family protein [Candidatus Azobacteroides sp.]|nr:CvpA family protein [Candidatus Azobacteroides sp.]